MTYLYPNDPHYKASWLAGKPGMPTTQQGVNHWGRNKARRKALGKGAGWEYPLSVLPQETREYLARESIKNFLENPNKTAASEAGRMAARKIKLAEDMDQAAEQKRREQALLASQTLTGKAADRDAAKHLILQALATYKAMNPGAKSVTVDFCVAYNRGEIEIDPTGRAAVRSISYPTLCRWQGDIKQGKHLGGHYGHRKGSGKIDSQPDVREFIVALLVDKPHASAKHIYQALEARFSARKDLELPAKRSLERWLNAWKKQAAEVFTAITNPDQWKNQYMVATGSASAQAEYVNHLWELDSSPADVMLTDGRHALLGVIDVHSRRARILVAKTSKAAAIGLLIRRAMLDWGVPDGIKTDNGQDYRSQHLARVCNALGITQTFSQPFSPWEKPHIERFFRTFSHGIAELLPGFIGHDVADRKAIEARKAFSDRLFQKDGMVEIRMDAAELQRFCDQWTETVYLHEAHGGLNGKTPFQMAQACRNPVRTIENERLLDLLLAEAPGDSWRTVGKKGIRIDKDMFIAPELERYVGQRVQCLYDPEDLGRVYVYAYDRPDDPLDSNATKPGLHFVAIAECPARLGISREEHAEKASEMRERQKKRVQEEKRKLKQLARKVDTDTVVDEILEHKRQQAATKLVQFPKQKIRHTTPGLDAAGEALNALENPNDRPLTVAEVEDMQARTQAAPKTTRPMFDSMFQRALWTAEVMMGDRQAELSGDDHEFMRELRRLSPATYRSAEDILNLKYEDRWDQYSEFRRAVGWPDARRPKA
jgi:putative transposase